MLDLTHKQATPHAYLIAIVRLDQLLQWGCVDAVLQLSWAAIAQAVSLPWRKGLSDRHRGQLEGPVHHAQAHEIGGYSHPGQVQVQLLAVLDGQQDGQVMTAESCVPTKASQAHQVQMGM